VTDVSELIERHHRLIHKARGVTRFALAVAVAEATIAVGMLQGGAKAAAVVVFAMAGVALWAAWAERRVVVRLRASLKALSIADYRSKVAHRDQN
jgi:hypothetical protein